MKAAGAKRTFAEIPVDTLRRMRYARARALAPAVECGVRRRHPKSALAAAPSAKFLLTRARHCNMMGEHGSKQQGGAPANLEGKTVNFLELHPDHSPAVKRIREELIPATVAQAAAFYRFTPFEITSDFDVRGHTAGYARLRSKHVSFNFPILVREGRNFDETVVHEVCHVLAYALLGDRGHGNGWRAMMRVCGYPNPSRCHTYETRAARRRKR